MKDEAEIVRRLRDRAELHLRHARWPMGLTYYSGDDAGMMVDAAAEIERLREQLAKRTDALKAAQSVLQVLVTPGNEKISSLYIWTQAVAAETGARIALTDDQHGAVK